MYKIRKFSKLTGISITTLRKRDEKDNKQSLIQNTELRTFSIRIKSDKLEKN